MNLIKELTTQIELHADSEIRRIFSAGINPNDSFEGKSLFDLLLGMYTRSRKFTSCVQAFVDYGLKYDKLLIAVLLDDAQTVREILANDSHALTQKISIPCAYTSLVDVSLLHVCAEFNLVKVANILIGAGLNSDTKAGIDAHGFGGQTPIFHTVNQNGNQSFEMLELLLTHQVDLSITVKGLLWGKDFPWETLIPSVNPISYAMMGMLPQMHRDEVTISAVVARLMKYQYGISYEPTNVPNKYLLS